MLLYLAVVSPAMLFGLATLPLTKVCLQKLGVVQRRMFRSIVGWVRIHDDQNWRDIMVQMNHRMAIANILFPMEDWEDRLFRSKFRLAHRIARSPEAWPAKSVSWNPLTNWESNFACMPQRKRGRPSARWDDTLTIFSTEFFRNPTIRNGGMLQVKFPCGSFLRDIMYSFAGPTLVCSHVK